MIPALATCLLLAIGASPCQEPPTSVHAGRLYVEPSGQDHEALFFRRLLSDDLSKGGVTVVQDASQADLVLIAVLSTPVVDGNTYAQALVDVTTQDGTVVWRGEFPAGKSWFQPNGRDSLRRLAEEIATAVSERRQTLMR